MAAYTKTISIDDINALIHLVVKGDLPKKEGTKIIRETRGLAEKFHYHILCDITDAKIDATMADWFYLMRNRDIFSKTQKEKTAILVDPDSRIFFKYVGNVIRNVGLTIRIFLNKEEALAWLKKVD